MKDETKSILCLIAAVVSLAIGAIIEARTGENIITGWFAVFCLGFGWYSRGAIIKRDAKRSKEE